ncbi:SAM-dependent methyltransferase [Flavobacteriaceae bacterium]|nr:SAM-dependent methyltransferase [Flavobacteriaceae bacterium]MDC1492409.1 SAM-dependent methyltransferase [Flavobacteriaceae bacterium]
MKGKLYLIPNTLGENEPLEVIPISVKKIIEATDYYLFENEKAGRKFIKKITPTKSQNSLKVNLINKFTLIEELNSFLDPIHKGYNIGLISDAGCPGVADPGSDIIKIAHQYNIKVIPLVGPSSILLAIMSSGLNGQNFAFNGYLPIERSEKKNKIKELEKISTQKNQSQIFIETPYRNNKMLEDLTKNLSGDTNLCVACDLTLNTEYIRTLTINEWRNNNINIDKKPAIFIIHKN